MRLRRRRRKYPLIAAGPDAQPGQERFWREAQFSTVWLYPPRRRPYDWDRDGFEPR